MIYIEKVGSWSMAPNGNASQLFSTMTETPPGRKDRIAPGWVACLWPSGVRRHLRPILSQRRHRRRQLKSRGPVREFRAAGQQGLEKPARFILFGIGVQRGREMIGDLAVAGLQGMSALEQGQRAG